MDLQLSGRTALVTGASQGIGKAVAHLLAREGVKVVMAARRIDLLEDHAHRIVRDGGVKPEILQADLYPAGAAENLAARAVQAAGGIDILVNSAGGSRPIPFDASKAQWEEGMTLNFWRLRELTHAIVPGMKERRFGRIVNMTGTSEPKIINAAFAAKAAVHVWAKGLSREIAPYGITINSLQPGRIHSEQMSKRYPTPESEKAFADAEIPVGRFGTAEEIAAVAVFLCSLAAAYVTGTVIPVDGGMSRFAF